MTEENKVEKVDLKKLLITRIEQGVEALASIEITDEKFDTVLNNILMSSSVVGDIQKNEHAIMQDALRRQAEASNASEANTEKAVKKEGK